MHEVLRSVSRGVAVISVLLLAAGGQTVARAACSPGDDCGVDFGGTNAYVSFGSTGALGLSTFTIETWFNRQGTGVTISTGTGGVTAIPLVTKGRGEADGSNVDMNYFLGIRASDNVLVADFEEGAGGSSPGLNHPVAGVTPIANGIWYHAAAAYDGTTWRLYLNGALETALSIGEPPRSDSIQHAGLATAMNSSGSPSGYFDGVLDEVRVWSVVRSEEDIQASINLEITTATGLVARWGLNEGVGTTVGDSSGSPQNGTVMGSNWAWVDGSPFNLSLPPEQPVLNAPPDGATGVSTSPTLDVSVSDPDADDLTVTFYGRDASTVVPDFTIVALPDTQYYSASLNGGTPAIFAAQTQWIVDNKDALNIVFVSQLGDCVEHGNNGGNDVEWEAADAAMSLLEDPLTTMLLDGIPYGITVGNHDQSPGGDPDGSSTTSYNEFFGVSRFLGRAYYGGHYGSNNDNHFQLFSASGMDFIVINFEYDTSPDAAVLSWANGLLQTYSSRRAIVVSHYLIGTGNPGSFGSQGQAIYDALKGNPNLFLMLSGHVPGEGRRQDTFNGKTVNTLLADYQSRANGGDGWLRIMTFRPSSNEIEVWTYSPTRDEFETDGDSAFTLSYDMGGGGFVPIATNTDVPSGTSTTASWPDLAPDTEHEWYVTVGDGGSTTTGPVWGFTTGDTSSTTSTTTLMPTTTTTTLVPTTTTTTLAPTTTTTTTTTTTSTTLAPTTTTTTLAPTTTTTTLAPTTTTTTTTTTTLAPTTTTTTLAPTTTTLAPTTTTTSSTTSTSTTSPTTTTTLPPAVCPPVPAATCEDGFARGSLMVSEKAAGRERLIAKFIKGPELTQGDFGGPLIPGGTAYDICIYNADNSLVGAMTVDRAGGDCAGKPCWNAIGTTGYKYKDKTLSADGILLMMMKGGIAGRSKALAKGKGGSLPTGLAAALQGSATATVQLIGRDAPRCLSITLDEVKKDDGLIFKALLK